LLHRRDFAEHPASADYSLPNAGQARRWHAGADMRGAWMILDSVPSHAALETLSAQLAAQGAIGMLLPQHPASEGYLAKRMMPAAPVALPVISVRADVLPSLDGKRGGAALPFSVRLHMAVLFSGTSMAPMRHSTTHR
jgi:hypothetical protein